MCFLVFFLQHLRKICYFIFLKSSIHQPLISTTLVKEIDDIQSQNYSCKGRIKFKVLHKPDRKPRKPLHNGFLYFLWKNTSSQIVSLPSRGQSCKFKGRGTKAVVPPANRKRPKEGTHLSNSALLIFILTLLKGNHYQHVERKIYTLKSLFLELLKKNNKKPRINRISYLKCQQNKVNFRETLHPAVKTMVSREPEESTAPQDHLVRRKVTFYTRTSWKLWYESYVTAVQRPQGPFSLIFTGRI